MSIIRLQSSDLEVVEVEAEFAKRSGWIRSLLEKSGNLDKQDLIPVTNVNGVVLRKVIEWLVYHKDEFTEYEESLERPEDLFTRDREFFDVEKEMLIDLVLAANFLDIQGLLEESCRAVANLIGTRSPGEIRQLLNCPDLSSTSSDDQSELSSSTANISNACPES